MIRFYSSLKIFSSLSNLVIIKLLIGTQLRYNRDRIAINSYKPNISNLSLSSIGIDHEH